MVKIVTGVSSAFSARVALMSYSLVTSLSRNCSFSNRLSAGRGIE
jgi:hypothetical protein